MSVRERVDVVIPTRDTRELTLRAVRSVLADRIQEVAVRCVVVDNGSVDGTPEAVAASWPQATLVRNAEDRGYARACNEGVRAGEGEYVLIMNSDVFARPGAVGRLTRFLRANPRHVAATGRLVDVGTDRPQVGFAVRGYPTLAGQVALLAGGERLWPANPVSRRQSMRDFDYDRTHDVDGQPAGACLLVRRRDYEAVGGFDEGFRYWFEDVDLLRRLSARGPIAYVHDAVFEHVGGATFARWSRPDAIVARHRSLLRYFEKHHPRREVIALRAVVGALAALRAVLLLPTRGPVARAYATVLGLALRGCDLVRAERSP